MDFGVKKIHVRVVTCENTWPLSVAHFISIFLNHCVIDLHDGNLVSFYQHRAQQAPHVSSNPSFVFPRISIRDTHVHDWRSCVHLREHVHTSCLDPKRIQRLTATSTLWSSRDKDPWGQVSYSVPTPVSVHYTLLHILVINLVTNFRRPPFTVTSIWVELSRPSYF